MIGSNHTTNEENYYLQKFAREALGTNNIDHHRTGDVPTLLDALSGKNGRAGHDRRPLRSQSDSGDSERSLAAASVPWRFRSAPITGITTRTSIP